MGKILLDYAFPISVIEPTPEASTAFLKQVCVVATPKSGQEGNVGTIYECSSMSAVAARTDNTNAQQLFNAGMSKVYVLLANDLDLVAALESETRFYTLLISDDFEDADIDDTDGDAAVAASLVMGDLTFTAKLAGVDGNDLSLELLNEVDDVGEEKAIVTGDKITVYMKNAASTAQHIKDAIDDSVAVSALITVAIATGQEAVAQAAAVEDDFAGGLAATSVGLQVGDFECVIGVSTQDADFAGEQAVKTRRAAFFTLLANGAKSMFFAFGSLLSNRTNWRNQQYIEMPVDDEIDELGEAESLFDDKVSFVLTDDEFGSRLALFAAGGKAIIAPYILKNLRVNLQSAAVSWISGNQPQYTIKEAALLETRLQEDVINEFIDLEWIEAGTVEISLVEDNFVANGEINVAEPKALWRVFSEMQQTL